LLSVLAGIAQVACDTRGRERADAVADSIVVQDHAQRTVRLDSAARRVISFMPAITDMLLALGAQDRLIARTAFDTDARIAHLPSTGNALTPSLEWVAAQKPDLVIAWPDQPSRSVVGRLSELGVPVYAAVTETNSDVMKAIRDLGLLLGLERRADSLTHAITSQLDAVRASVQSRPRERVAYVLSIEPLMVAGPGTYIDELIAVAGGQNVFSDVSGRWSQVSLEELLKRDPAAIVIATDSGDALARVRALPAWRKLAAVREGRVIRVDPSLFNRPGPAIPAAARELARFLHPDARL
jgi:iron complex transport system substrate-binding protein